MQATYSPLRSKPLPAGTTFRQPVLPQPRRVTLADAALDVMTDFQRVRAITVPDSVSMDHASHRMRANRVHLLLVTDDRNIILGLVTSTDIEGERPLLQIERRRVRRSEITVRDIMTPRERLEVIDIAEVRLARVGHVVATLEAVGRQHAMVVDHDEDGHARVRGLFSVSQLNRQLGSAFAPVEIARSFADVELALCGNIALSI
jgi:CBS domain containing-hemolysin-like protein